MRFILSMPFSIKSVPPAMAPRQLIVAADNPIVRAPLELSSISKIGSNEIQRLIADGTIKFALSDGKEGRLVYREAVETRGTFRYSRGFYLGFALKDQTTGKEIVHARLILDTEKDLKGRKYLTSGSEAGRIIKQENQCGELESDPIPFLVSAAIRKQYKGIGSALLGIALLIAKTNKIDYARTLFSIVDSFYLEKGFVRGAQSEYDSLYFILNLSLRIRDIDPENVSDKVEWPIAIGEITPRDATNRTNPNIWRRLLQYLS